METKSSSTLKTILKYKDNAHGITLEVALDKEIRTEFAIRLEAEIAIENDVENELEIKHKSEQRNPIPISETEIGIENTVSEFRA